MYKTSNPLLLCNHLNVGYLSKKLVVDMSQTNNSTEGFNYDYSFKDENEDFFIIACRLGHYLFNSHEKNLNLGKDAAVTFVSTESQLFAVALLLDYYYTKESFNYSKLSKNQISKLTNIPYRAIDYFFKCYSL